MKPSGEMGSIGEKWTNSSQLVTKLKNQGVPIDAAGIEMHLEAQNLHPNYVDEFKYFLSGARKAGVEAHVTEMDVYQGPAGAFPDAFANQKEIFYNVARSLCAGLELQGIQRLGSGRPGMHGIPEAA